MTRWSHVVWPAVATEWDAAVWPPRSEPKDFQAFGAIFALSIPIVSALGYC